ncbi:MAG TPA: hypothetical protein VE010_16375 [Thermoanaerobaculia bacterium]|nr:hypothetical protein [Thermoanaerobaculia bacterium]
MEQVNELPPDVLVGDEQILLRASATGPQPRSVAWLLSTSRRVALLFTNQRLLCVKRSAAEITSISEIRWSDVRRASVSRISLRLSLRYGDGRGEAFTFKDRGEANAARALLASLVPVGAAGRFGRRPLCPACYAKGPQRVSRCESCGVAFRDPRAAVRFALWWPGGGYFFLRRHTAALFAVVFELFLLVLVRTTWRFHELERVHNPWTITLLLVLVWCIWKAASAMHVAAAARELIVDLTPEKRNLQIPPVVLATTARDVGQVGVAAAVATGTAAATAVAASARAGTAAVAASARAGQQIVAEATAQIAASPQYQRILDLGNAGPAPFLTGELPEEELENELLDLLSPIARAFQPLLEPGERVLHATRGAMPYSLLDYVGSVVLLYFVRRCVYVFTDRRMFAIRVSLKGRPLPTVSAVWYGDVASFSFAGGFGFTVNMKLSFVYRNGRKETFNRIPLADLERIRAFLPDALESTVPAPATPERFRERRHFCSWCGSMLRPRVYTCITCGATYRKPAIASALAAFVPGGGYFYVRMPKLGTADALLESFLILNGAGFLVGALSGSGPGYKAAAAFACVLLLIEKLVSIRHATEEALEFVPHRDAKIFAKPMLATTTDEQRLVNGLVVAAGVTLIAAFAAVRVPLYPLQIELATHTKELEERHPHVAALRNEHDAIVHDLEALRAETNKLYYALDRSDPAQQRRLDEGYEALRIKENEYQASERRFRALEEAHHERLERVKYLEERIGDTWMVFTPEEALLDLVVRASEAASPSSPE